jgi:choline dehydrogenase
VATGGAKRRSYLKAECNQRGADRYHGGSGPLYVSNAELQYTIAKVFIEAATQAGLPFNDDFNGANPEGFGAYQFTIKNGKRWSTAVAYLHPVMDRKNLTVITSAEVVKLVLEDKRAVAVTYEHKGERKTVEARKEVILSAGAYNSPKLLMLSGVGDPAELKAHGLEVAHALPGVGKNLQEHADAAILTASHFHGGVQFSLVGVLQMVGEGIEYYGADLGKLRASLIEAGGFLKTDASLKDPDVQFHTVPLLFDDSGRNLRLMTHDGYSCHVCVLHPKSRGRIDLRSANPAAPPIIDHNFFDHPEDMKTLVAGVRLARYMLAAPAFDKYRKEEIHPGLDKQSNEAIAQACRDKLGIVYHPVGTCKMGKDDMAVMDPQLRVRGIEGLRVVDASIMPTITGGNTNAPTIMIAEKASDMILRG